MGQDLAERPPTDLTPAEQSEAKALEALDAIDQAKTPEEAESILRGCKLAEDAARLGKYGRNQERRWAGVAIKAERRYGDLLGPAEHGGDRKSAAVKSTGTVLVDRDYEAEKWARKVYAIPEQVVDEYLEEAEEPTRAGLLREARKHEPPVKTKRRSAEQAQRIARENFGQRILALEQEAAGLLREAASVHATASIAAVGTWIERVKLARESLAQVNDLLKRDPVGGE